LNTGTVDFCEVCLKLQHYEINTSFLLTVSVGSSGVDFIFKTNFLKTARNNSSGIYMAQLKVFFIEIVKFVSFGRLASIAYFLKHLSIFLP